MTTIKQVAQRAQVSTATVSKVITKTPYVSEETRARVLQAIEELGYTPNFAARALNKKLTYNVGVIFPYYHDRLFTDPYILTIAEGIEEVCTNHEYNLLISTPRVPLHKAQQYNRFVQGGYIDGLIGLQLLPDDPVFKSADEFRYPCISIGYHPLTSNVNAVYSDNFNGAKAMAGYILGLGHEDIAIIGVSDASATGATQRRAGFQEAIEEAGLDFNSIPIVEGTFSYESGYRAAARLLSQRKHPTAILCFNDRMAMGAIHCIRASGLHVPGDITVVGFDNIPNAEYFSPPLTTVAQPGRKMGVRAAELLFELIAAKSTQKFNHPGFPPEMFPTELVIRASASAPKGR
jgi:DNA-binding LacI/PurR family transcriptional regulator